jgi:methenyltetrahydrofolate cyclohydrolase
MTGEETIAGFAAALAARQPTPGGGAAAAVAAALACATGAMACRYTNGDKYQTVAAEAAALADRLDAWRTRCLALADADATAYAAVGTAKKTKDPAHIAAAETAAAAVPAELLALCAEAASACADFRPRCNPWLVSDIDTATHLLTGAGRAAWRTLLINQPGDELRRSALTHLARLAAAELPCA